MRPLLILSGILNLLKNKLFSASVNVFSKYNDFSLNASLILNNFWEESAIKRWLSLTVCIKNISFIVFFGREKIVK